MISFCTRNVIHFAPRYSCSGQTHWRLFRRAWIKRTGELTNHEIFESKKEGDGSTMIHDYDGLNCQMWQRVRYSTEDVTSKLAVDSVDSEFGFTGALVDTVSHHKIAMNKAGAVL